MPAPKSSDLLLAAAAEAEESGLEIEEGDEAAQRRALALYRQAHSILNELPLEEVCSDYRVLEALLRLHIACARVLTLLGQPYLAMQEAAEALRLPSPAAVGGAAVPTKIAEAQRLQAKAVLTMEKANEMYYGDESEHLLILRAVRRGLVGLSAANLAKEADLKDLELIELLAAGGRPFDSEGRLMQRAASFGKLHAAGSAAQVVTARRQARRASTPTCGLGRCCPPAARPASESGRRCLSASRPRSDSGGRCPSAGRRPQSSSGIRHPSIGSEPRLPPSAWAAPPHSLAPARGSSAGRKKIRCSWFVSSV
eukprot:s4_g21.t1